MPSLVIVSMAKRRDRGKVKFKTTLWKWKYRTAKGSQCKTKNQLKVRRAKEAKMDKKKADKVIRAVYASLMDAGGGRLERAVNELEALSSMEDEEYQTAAETALSFLNQWLLFDIKSRPRPNCTRKVGLSFIATW